MIKVRCEAFLMDGARAVSVYQCDDRNEVILKNWHDMVYDKIMEGTAIERGEFLAFCSYHIVSSLRRKIAADSAEDLLQDIFYRNNVRRHVCDGLLMLRFEAVADRKPKMIINLDCTAMAEA